MRFLKVTFFLYLCRKLNVMEMQIRKTLSILFGVVVVMLLAGCNSSIDMEQQVDELYSKMSQEERVAQLRSMYMDEFFDE